MVTLGAIFLRNMGTSLVLLALAATCLSNASAQICYARNFELQDEGTHQLLTVRNTSRGSKLSHQYALVPKSQPLPDLPEATAVIRIPVERMVAMETVHIGFLDTLDQLDSVIAAATVDYISHPDIITRLATGEIESVQTGQALDVEKLLLLQPDLILTSTIGDPSFDLPAKLARTGLPVVLTADYMERHPLARAEWIKFLAAFYEEDEAADRIFDKIEKRYLELADLGREADEKPTVMCGAPYGGIWHVPGGDSYTAQLIRDAGGDYLWSEDKTRGGIPLDTERVFLKAAEADFWIHPSFYRSMDALLSADARFGKFAAAKAGKIYNNTRQVTASGGNAIWESGVVRPDAVLADLIRIFHPEILPEHEKVYYEHLR